MLFHCTEYPSHVKYALKCVIARWQTTKIWWVGEVVPNLFSSPLPPKAKDIWPLGATTALLPCHMALHISSILWIHTPAPGWKPIGRSILNQKIITIISKVWATEKSMGHWTKQKSNYMMWFFFPPWFPYWSLIFCVVRFQTQLLKVDHNCLHDVAHNRLSTFKYKKKKISPI